MSLLFLSCTKSDNGYVVRIHPLEQFIGKWVPYEISFRDEVSFGPFSYNSIFSAYNDSFEVLDTMGSYIPAVYYSDSIGNMIFEIVPDKKGELNYDKTTNTISFFEENIYWVDGQLEFKSDRDIWITSNNVSGQRIIKIKKI